MKRPISAVVVVAQIARGTAGSLPLVLLDTVPSAIAASLSDPLAADQQSDRAQNLDDAIDAALDAAEARKAANAPPAAPKEFSVRINAPLYYNSNILLGQSGLEGNPEIALGWSPNWTSLPFKPTVKLKEESDRYTNVPQASQDQASGSFRLSYFDATDDQAWAPFFSYKLEAIYGATFSPWLETKNDFNLGFDKLFSFDDNFRPLPDAANSRGVATWTLGLTAYVQRRVRTSPSNSLALYVVPSATYVPSSDWIISLTMETWERWYQSVLAKPISRRDFEINPILAIAYDPSTLLGGHNALGSPQIALEIGFDNRSSSVVNKSFKQWTLGPVLSVKWKF